MMKRVLPITITLLLLLVGIALADSGPTPTPVTLYFPTMGSGAAATPSGHALPTAWRLFWQQYASPILLVLAVGAWLALRRHSRRKG